MFTSGQNIRKSSRACKNYQRVYALLNSNEFERVAKCGVIDRTNESKCVE